MTPVALTESTPAHATRAAATRAALRSMVVEHLQQGNAYLSGQVASTPAFMLQSISLPSVLCNKMCPAAAGLSSHSAFLPDARQGSSVHMTFMFGSMLLRCRQDKAGVSVDGKAPIVHLPRYVPGERRDERWYIDHMQQRAVAPLAAAMTSSIVSGPLAVGFVGLKAAAHCKQCGNVAKYLCSANAICKPSGSGPQGTAAVPWPQQDVAQRFDNGAHLGWLLIARW